MVYYLGMDINDMQDIYVNTQNSWFELVEDELKESIDDKVLSGSSEVSIENAEDIICLDYEECSDLQILQYETCVATYLRNQFKNITEEDMLHKLKWLLNVTKYLSKKIGSDMDRVEKGKNKYDKNTSKIIRSSYTFCDFNHKCEYNYSVNKNKGCYAQHFVHNIIYHDIQSIIKYLENTNGATDSDKNEIRKSINTISYVMNHMYDELKESGIHANRFLVKSKKRNKKNKKQIKGLNLH